MPAAKHAGATEAATMKAESEIFIEQEWMDRGGGLNVSTKETRHKQRGWEWVNEG